MRRFKPQLVVYILSVLFISRILFAQDEYDNANYLVTTGTGIVYHLDDKIKYAIPVIASAEIKIISKISAEFEILVWVWTGGRNPGVLKHSQYGIGPRYWFTNPLWRFYFGGGVSYYEHLETNKDFYPNNKTGFAPYAKFGYVIPADSTYGYDFGIRYDAIGIGKDFSYKQPITFYIAFNYRG